MITEHDVKWQWTHRHKMINIKGMPCNEEEVLYIIEVLHLLDIPHGECYLTDDYIIRKILEAHEWGVDSLDCAGRLMKANETIGEYA